MGERIILRPWRESDFKELAKIANNKKIAQNMSDVFPYPYTINFAKKWLKEAGLKEKKKKNFAIEVDGRIIGGVWFRLKKGSYKGVAVGGYWLGEDFWGNGFATEAWILLRDYVFLKFKVRRLEAEVFSWNLVSKKVQEKCGFKEEGCLTQSALRFGKVGDEFIYAILRKDWEKIK